MNIYKQIDHLFMRGGPFFCATTRKRFLFSVNKYSKNLIKNIVKITF